jgi:hypothetical protein
MLKNFYHISLLLPINKIQRIQRISLLVITAVSSMHGGKTNPPYFSHDAKALIETKSFNIAKNVTYIIVDSLKLGSFDE